MTAWAYDSYCNENVFEYIEQYTEKELFSRVEKDMSDYIYNEISENDYEFILGVSIYCIRKKCKFSNDYLRELRDIVVDSLIKFGKFNDWVDKELRIKKIQHERLIINNLLRGRELKFGNLLEKIDAINLKY